MIHHETYGRPVPELDSALIEYFADTAFDPRLDTLFEDRDILQMDFDAHTESDFDVYPPLLVRNYVDLDDAGNILTPTTRLRAFGKISYAGEKKNTSIDLISAEDPADRLKIQSNDEGKFFAYESGTPNITELSRREVARISLLAQGYDATKLDRLSDIVNDNDDEYQQVIDYVWGRAAEVSASKHVTKIIQREGTGSTAEKKMSHRLSYVEHSSALEDDVIEITYEHVTTHVELEAEEIYRLYLKYTNHGTSIERNAQKIIRSTTGTGMELDDVKFFHQTSDGSTKELDPNDPNIMRLFVDSFEELLDSAQKS